MDPRKKSQTPRSLVDAVETEESTRSDEVRIRRGIRLNHDEEHPSDDSAPERVSPDDAFRDATQDDTTLEP